MAKRNPQETTGDRVRQARELGGVSQFQLSKIAFLQQNHVRAIEVRASMTSDTAIALAKALGVSLDWLLRGIGPRPTKEGVRAAIREAEERHEQHRKSMREAV